MHRLIFKQLLMSDLIGFTLYRTEALYKSQFKKVRKLERYIQWIKNNIIRLLNI